MPIFQKNKNQREATSLQQLQVFNRSSQLKPVDLCSHNYLLKEANIFAKIEDKNETILNDLQEMIQKMRAIVLERAAVVAKEATDSEKELVTQLVDFINLQILQISKCQKFAQNDEAQLPSSFSKISKTGLDYAYTAQQNFGRRIKNFVQARTFNFIFDAIQLIIVQFRDFLLHDCLDKEQKTDTIPMIQSLLILCASIQDKRSKDLNKQFSLKEETYRTLIYIINRITNVSTLNFAVKVLEINEKDYPTDFDEAHEFSLKMVIWSELTNFSILNNIKSSDDKIHIQLDFEPEITLPKKYNYCDRKKTCSLQEAIDRLYSEAITTETSESDHDDMLSNYVTLQNPVSITEKRAAKLMCNLEIDIKSLNCLPQALQEILNQQDLSVTTEEKVVFLRDSAKAILQWAYNEIRNKVLERGGLDDRILPWEDYTKKYERYIERGVLPMLEAELVYTLQFNHNRTQFLQLGISSLEKILNRVQNFEGLYGNYFSGLKDPLKIKQRVQAFVKNDIINICFKFVENSFQFENQQINEENLEQEQILEQTLTLFYWKLLCLLIKQIRKSQTFNPHLIHPVLKKLLCNEDKNNQSYDGTKAFLLDLLTQTNQLTCEGYTLNDLIIKQKNKHEDDEENFQKKVNIGCYLLTNYHFQNYLWRVASCVYTTVCSLIKDIPGQILQSNEIHKLCQNTKHDLEIVGQIQLLKMPKQLESGQQILINPSSSVIQLIASTLIRSSWVTEGVTIRQQQEDQVDTQNINKLINLLLVYLKALFEDSAHTVISKISKNEPFIERKISKEKLVQAINSIMSRITLDRHNPNHPQNYYEIIIQSQLFNEQTLGNLIDLNYIEKESEIGQIALHKLNLQFILFLTNVFQNDPSQIGKLVDNGILRSLINFLTKKIMPLRITFINIISLLQAISIHEKGLALIKETKIFDKYMMPSSESQYKKMAILVAQDTNESWRNYHELTDLLRHNDQYFIDCTKKVFSAIFSDVIPKIKVLQKQFYDHLSLYFDKNEADQVMSSTLIDSESRDLPLTKSYNKFLVEVTEKLTQTEEYYLVKYELWKIRMTVSNPQNHHYHNNPSIFPSIIKLFQKSGNQECLLTRFFQVYKMLSTVKPVFEYNQQPKKVRESFPTISSLFQDLNVIVNSVINQENNIRGEHHIQTFTSQLQEAMKSTKLLIIQTANIVESHAADNPYSFKIEYDSQNQKKVNELKEVDWVDMLQKIDKAEIKYELKDQSDSLVSEISPSNLRGHIIARISMTTQMCEAFLKLSRQIQQAIAQQVKWEQETIDLQGLQFSLMRSNNQCTGLFFENQDQFLARHYITQTQSKFLSFIYKAEITSEQEMILKSNRKQIEGNLENFRQDLLFFQTGSNEISSVLNMMSEAWIDRRRDTKNNKVHFQKLINVTISDLKIGYLINELENETKRSLNSPRFLAGLSHLFFVVSLLNEFILRGLVDGQGFVMFIDKGFLREIVQIFTFLRKLNLKKMIKESTFDEETASKDELDKCLNFVAYSCYQSICRDIKGMISKFITLSNSLANFNEPTLLEILKTDDLYESEQQFFCNYFYQLTSGLLYQDGNKNQETKTSNQQTQQVNNNELDQNMEDTSDQEKTQNLWWLSDNPQLPELNRTLHDNNDIKEIQIQIVTSLSNLFQKCKYLKEGEFSQKIRNNNQDGSSGSAQQMPDLVQSQAPKKPHRDENSINQCCLLGFDRKLVRKALKLTGDVNMAITFLLDGDISRLIPMSDSEEEIAKIQEEANAGLTKSGIVDDLNNSHPTLEQLRLEQLEKEKTLKRASFISTQNFYKFMELMQKEGLQITKDWFQQNQVSYKNRKFSKIYEQYICNLIQNNILPKTPTLQQFQQSIYEQTFKSFSKDINTLQDFQLFGGNNQDFENLLVLLNEIRQKLQFLYKLQNMSQLQDYFKEQKANKDINKTALQNSVIFLVQTLIEGKLNQNPKDFFKIQTDLLKELPEKIKVQFLTYCLELLFRGLQMFRILEQRYVYKYQKTQNKLNFSDKNQTSLIISMDKAKYEAKSQAILKQIEEDANKRIGQKTYQYCITCAYGLSQFKLSKENLQELKELSAQVIDASKIIQITQNQILNQLCQKYNDENTMQDVEQSSSNDLDFIDFGLGSLEQNELTLQQTKASSTLNIFQMQNIVFSKDKFKITLSHLIKKILESKAKKQSQYRQFSKDSPLQKCTDIKIQQKDSEVDLKKFINDFRTQVLGIGKITVQQNPPYALGQRQPPGEVQKNISQPSNEYSAKIFSDAMLKAIPFVCQVSMPSKQIKENAEKSHISLKENVIQDINSNQSKIKVNLSQQELKLYQDIMLQLVQSGQLWVDIVKKSWKDEAIIFESIQDWNQMTMIALRNLSCIIRSSFDRKSTLLQKIENDFKNNNEYSLLNWIKDIYFPLRLLGNHTFKVNQKLQNNEQAKANIFMIADYNEQLDKNVCLFLNELTGYGHLYTNEAIQQRKVLRESLIVSCLETISTCVNENSKNLAKTQGYLQMDIMQKSKLISSIMIIQYLINQYNQFEFNRVVLSRTCFQDTFSFLFDWQSVKKEGFLCLINTLLEQVQWLSLGPLRKEITTGKLKKEELLEKLQQVTTQAFATQMIDRITQILSIVTVYQEEIHKREEKLKQIERSELKKLNKQKKVEQNMSQNTGDILMENQQVEESNQQQLNQDNQIQPNNSVLDQPLFQNPNPDEQNESISDEDDDFQDMSEQEHSNSQPSSSSSNEEPPHDMPEEDEESQADEENFNPPMIPAGIMDESEQEDDDVEEDGDEEEHVEVHNNQNMEILPDVEDDEDEEDLDEDDEEMGGIEEMELIEEYDEEEDMLHAERDLILQMQRQHGRRIDELQERDLLGQESPFIHHQSNRHRQRHPDDSTQLAFGIYPHVQQRQPNSVIPIPAPPGQSKDESHVYHIEFDIIPAYAKGPFGKGSRLQKSIEEIKREQAKASNNQISSIFQILKPLSLQNFSTLSQSIEQQFLQSMGMRETRRAEVERKERKLKKQVEGIFDSDDDEVFGQEIGQIAGLHNDLNLRRADLFMIEENEDVDVRQELLLNIRAHIDRMEQELQGIVGLGFRNPAAGNPFQFQIGPHGSLERERVRAAQQASNQEMRDASMSWDNFIQRDNESNAQENITNLLTNLVNLDQIVIEQPPVNENQPEITSPPVPIQLQEELINAPDIIDNRLDSRINYPDRPINLENRIPNPFVSSQSSILENPPQQPNQQQPDQNLLDQAILSDFFRGFAVQQPLVEQLNQNLQQPVSNNDQVQQNNQQQNQEIDQAASVNDQEQQPDQSQASNSAQISVGAMIRALDDINVEMQDLEQQIQQESPAEISNQVANFELNLRQDNDIEEENPVIQELIVDQNNQPQPEALENPIQNIVEEEQFTFGYPHSLLRQNEIEPELLNEVPEDVRVEILSTIQDQFEEWQRNRVQQNNVNAVQVNQNQPVELPSQVIQLQEQQLDPDLARAIALGLDPEFVANLPAEMIRELLQNEQFLADNTGQPIQRAAPQREPEPMDVASIIATVQDPGLRREMLLNLTVEQIDQLPAALRTEAINLRQGGGRHNFMENLFNNAAAMGRRDRAPRVPDRNQRPGRDQEGFFDIIDRYRNMDIRGMENHHLHERMNRQRKILQDPNQISLDEILNSFTKELDQISQDDIIHGPIQSKLADKIQMQLIGSSSISSQKDNNIEDRLVRNSLQNLIFQEFRNDTAQLIRLLMKQKAQISLKSKNPPQEIQNKIINSLTFLLQTCSENNKLKLLQFFEMPLDQNQLQQLKLNEQHWTQIFLRICFVLEHFLKKNKKLVEHLLRCLIQSDKEFFGKSDQCIQSMAKILQNQNDLQIQEKQTIRPPLAIIISVMRDESEARYKLTRMGNLDQKQQVTLKENNSKLVSIKSLTQEIIKQFDLLYDDKLSNPKAGSVSANLERQAKILQLQENKQTVSTFGQLSVDSVKSLTDLLYLPYIDKKLLTALGNFMFRVSSLTLLDFHLCSNAKEIEIEDNKNDFIIKLGFNSETEAHQLFKKAASKAASICSSNFDLILSQYKQIGSANLNQINEILWKINNITGHYEPINLQQQRSFTQIDKTISQINSTSFSLSSKQKKNESAKKLSAEEKQELKDLVIQLKTESSPFIHVLNMFSFFLQKLLENKEQYKKSQSTIYSRISQRVETQRKHTEQISELIKEQNTKLQDEAQTAESIKEIEDKVVQNRKDIEKLQKDIEEDTKLSAFIELMLKMQKISIEKIQEFYTSDSLNQFVDQTNQFLFAIQKIGGDFMEDDSKMLLNFVFECFYPEMLLEVIYNENKKREEEQLKMDLDSDPLAQLKPKEIESKYVKMESIQQIISDNLSVQSDRMEGLETLKSSGQKLRSILQQPQLLVFRHEIDQVSDRLVTFNNFCLQNKEMLNKMVKSSSRNIEDESNSDLKRVSQLVKYMPNLLNFDNKRALFKKEIKKMRRQYGAHALRLNIRRNEIFMDAYSQMGHLTPSELKGKITVDFTGERGQDVGGLTRDFFIELSKEMFNQNYSLFKNSDNGSTYMPNPRSYVQPDHIRYFKFIGRVIGKALFEGCLLECYFVRSIYKMLIGQRLNFKDLEDLDNSLYTGLNWCLQPSSDVEALDETFSSNQDYFGRSELIDLIPNGRNVDLKNENKEYYVERKAYYTLYLSVQKQIDAFLEGFYEIIPRDLISIFSYKELELLISGMPDYKISDLKANTNYNGYTANSPQIIWFWEIMETLDRTEKGNLLQFVTGSSKVPVEGFANLQGMGGNAEKFQISRIVTNDTMRLPQGHTCFNQLDLPEYPSKEILEERLMWAIKETQGFGFA